MPQIKRFLPNCNFPETLFLAQTHFRHRTARANSSSNSPLSESDWGKSNLNLQGGPPKRYGPSVTMALQASKVTGKAAESSIRARNIAALPEKCGTFQKKIRVFKGHARYVRGPRTSETRNIRQKPTIPGLLIIILFKRPGTQNWPLHPPPSRILKGEGGPKLVHV